MKDKLKKIWSNHGELIVEVAGIAFCTTIITGVAYASYFMGIKDATYHVCNYISGHSDDMIEGLTKLNAENASDVTHVANLILELGTKTNKG